MRINIRGADLLYTVTGEGETVLLLHGGFESSAGYGRLIAALSDGFRVIAVDRRGHGGSTDTGEPFGYADMAEETHEFITKLALGAVHIVGYSDGANTALHLASTHPESVKNLVAVSGNCKGLTGMSEKWLGMLPQLSLEYVKTRMPQVLEQYLAQNPAPAPETYIAKTRALWQEEVGVPEEKLAAITAKTLLVAGDRDIVLPEQTLAMRSLIPGSSLLLLPETGHFILQDFVYGPRAEAAVLLIRGFLAASA